MIALLARGFAVGEPVGQHPAEDAEQLEPLVVGQLQPAGRPGAGVRSARGGMGSRWDRDMVCLLRDVCLLDGRTSGTVRACPGVGDRSRRCSGLDNACQERGVLLASSSSSSTGSGIGSRSSTGTATAWPSGQEASVRLPPSSPLYRKSAGTPIISLAGLLTAGGMGSNSRIKPCKEVTHVKKRLQSLLPPAPVDRQAVGDRSTLESADGRTASTNAADPQRHRAPTTRRASRRPGGAR